MKIVVGFLLINFLVLWHSNSVVASSETEKSSTAPLETIYFESDSVDILNAGAIEENADWLKGHKSRVVILEGHCDERGDRDYNYSLGDRRARAVLKDLVDKGVSPDQLIVMSRGKDRPAVSSGGQTGWAKNRRVEFVVR